MLQLKEYQQRTLDALKDYFVACRKTGNADESFYHTTLTWWGQGIPYKNVQELPGLPYICLRIPTGGGKTLVACHAAGLARRELLGSERNIILWLVPSNAIREQTINALRDRRHPYREALEAGVGPVEVLDISQALYLQASVADGQTVVIVSTMQAFRVDDTEGRKVYDQSGHLDHHFAAIRPKQAARLECYENGKPIPSLANVLKLRRPIVIVDEAHNARTELSFATLARFAPSCILEFTATPDTEKQPSNVLYRATAAELKAEEMIKIPIKLETHPDWKQLLTDAVAVRAGLEKAAALEQQQTGEYIRPVMLMQAQMRRRGREVISPEVIKRALMDDHLVPVNQIAIATGEIKELEGVDILTTDCELRFVITVEALREGWDCPFAYVLYTVAENYSSKAVEQILGRVLRMPQAKTKQQDPLNHAYAYASSTEWPRVAASLTDALVQNGFNRLEAKDLIRPQAKNEPTLFDDGLDDGLFANHITVEVPGLPTDVKLPREVKEYVSLDTKDSTITIMGVMPEQVKEKLKKAFEDKAIKEIIETAYQSALTRKQQSQTLRKLPNFRVPNLAIHTGTFWEQFEQTHFLEYEWSLASQEALLTEKEYSGNRPTGKIGEIDVAEDGSVAYEYLQNLWGDISSLESHDSWTESDLVIWLDNNIPHRDITPIESRNFLVKVIRALIDQRKINLGQLVIDKIRLRDAIEDIIDCHRKEAINRSFQNLLFGDNSPIEVSPACCFEYDANKYPYSTLYRGAYQFKKHYYPQIGDLRDHGEEFECAEFLDQLPEIEYWIRNLERREDTSFWLQTPTDKFYPDFVCLLKDGRYMVVEYKGADRWSNDDSKEKRLIGEVWEKRSGGKCLFIMPNGRDFESIRQKAQ